MSEQHEFRPGSAAYGQEPQECFYCWEPESEHAAPELELHGLLDAPLSTVGTDELSAYGAGERERYVG